MAAAIATAFLFARALSAGAPEAPVRVEVPASRLESPRLQALKRKALPPQRFWDEVRRQGAPLLEPATDPRYDLVTFLWRDDGRTGSVFILGNIGNTVGMTRLAGTDVWYRSYRIRKDARFNYRLAPHKGADLDPARPADRDKIRETARLDPLNPRRYPPGDAPFMSIVELPGAPPQPWIARRPAALAGKVWDDTVRSAYLQGNRPVTVYTPAGYEDGGPPRPLLIVLDGSAYRDIIPLPTILDNLSAEKRITPPVAVLVGQLDAPERESDLGCNPAFTRFLAQELLPWVRSRYRVAAAPASTVLVGSSFGGLGAACAAVDRPDLFGNLLVQSGSFWWKPEGAHRWEWMTRQLAARPKLPLRLALDVGLLETWPAEETGPSILASNRRLRDVLRRKGYEISYKEFAGGHAHASWQVSLPDDLMFLLRPGR
ncbi:MAG: enterochelin esterase [Thermoanaerobaculia bacterium]